MLIVQKYGGTSVADCHRVIGAARSVAQLVREGNQMVVVVSAQGKTTDRLVYLASEVNPDAPARELDAYLAAGEQMSAGLMTMALQAQGIAAVSLTGWQAGLQTDGVHGNAKVLGLGNDRIRQELDKGNTVVVAGFQGVGPDGDVTTLGRGGSDTTAVALAAFLHSDSCRIYTDVDGVYDRDPRKFPEAVKFDRIGYDAMLKLCREGAQVLHDRCVELAKQYQVPIRVLSTFRGGPGTLVCDDTQ